MQDEQTGGAGLNDGGADLDANLSKSDRDYKSDMLRFKDMFQESQSRITELERKLEDRDIEVAKTSGDKDKVIQSLQSKLEQYDKRLKSSDYRYAKTNVESMIREVAAKRHCNDPDLLIKFIGDEKIGKVTVDGEYKPDMTEIDLLIDDAMKNTGHIGLFGKDVRVTDKAPNNKPIEIKKENKPMTQLSNDELLDRLKSLPNEKRIADL